MNKNYLITNAADRLNELVEKGLDNTWEAQILSAFLSSSFSLSSLVSEIDIERRRHHETCLSVLAQCEQFVPDGLASVIRTAIGSGKDRFNLKLNHGTSEIKKVPASVSIAA